MTDEPVLPVVCARCWCHGKLVPATSYLAGNSLCTPHREEMEDDLAARWDEIAHRLEDA